MGMEAAGPDTFFDKRFRLFPADRSLAAEYAQLDGHDQPGKGIECADGYHRLLQLHSAPSVDSDHRSRPDAVSCDCVVELVAVSATLKNNYDRTGIRGTNDMSMKTVRMSAMALLLVFALGGCSSSPQARRDKHLTRGKELVNKREYSRAILEFRNAVQAMPKDAEPYYQIGVASSAAGDVRTAYLSFRRATELDPRHANAQLRLAQMLAHGDQPHLKDAEERLKAVLGHSSIQSPEMLNTLAFTELRLGKAKDAEETLEQALAQSPGELTSAVLLARTKLWQKDIKGAEEVLTKACEQTPGSADARRILGEFYVIQGKLTDAEPQLRRAFEMDPNSSSIIQDLARLDLTLGRKQDAEKRFKRLAGFEEYKSIYATFLFQEGRREEALREFEKIVARSPDNRQARSELVATYVAMGRTPEAVKVLEAAIKKNPKDGDALLQRAEILIRMGKLADAETDINQVRRIRSAAPEVHYVAAKLHEARGTTLTYRQELAETLRLNPTLEPVRVELAHNLVNSNEPRAALDLLNAAPDVQKASAAIVEQRNWANWALGDMTEMRRGIDHGLAQKRSVNFLVQDGLWKLRKGDANGARAVFEEALKIDPFDVRPLQFLSQSYARTKDSQLALQKVKEYAARQPKSAPVQQLLGKLLMAEKDHAGARSAFMAAKAADPQFVEADLSLAQLDVRDRKISVARNKIEGILAVKGGDIAARQWLASVQVIEGNSSASIENFRKVVAADPRNSEALNNLAYLLADRGAQLDEALKYAEKAVELAPDQPEYYDTLGWVLYRKGIYASAVKYLERTDKESAVSKYHLAMAYAKAGDPKRGRSALEAALKLNPDRPEAKLARQVVEQAR